MILVDIVDYHCLFINGCHLWHWQEPKNKNNPDDLKASETGNQFFLGWYANPVFVNGDYPDVMKYKIGNKSIHHQNFKSSRLPSFTDYEKNYIKGIT
jgi:lactase-phlorizin hydrolase